jgi:glycosyltransferase involved in cell wall biosynthesis
MLLLTTNQIHVIEYQGHHYNRSDGLVGYDHLRRIFRHADAVTVLVRSRRAQMLDLRWPQVDGDRVVVADLPDPVGLGATILSLPAMLGRIRRAAGACDRFHLKLPDATATLVGLYLWITGRRFGVEVVADCRQGLLYAKGRSPGLRVAAWVLDGLTGFLVRRAVAATYVSRYLQARYPHRRQDRQWVICSADLTDEMLAGPRPQESFQTEPLRLISAGRLSAEKGHIHLVEAFARICKGTGRSLELHLVGDGPQRAALEQACTRLGVGDRLFFHGFINHGPRLREMLDRAHIYILPSLTEGMGRGLIEAMARGLPCLASAVGGVPEYLPEEALFRPADPQAIADKVLALADQPGQLAALSQHNFATAKALHSGNLEPARQAFWRALRDG